MRFYANDYFNSEINILLPSRCDICDVEVGYAASSHMFDFHGMDWINEIRLLPFGWDDNPTAELTIESISGWTSYQRVIR
jgi:hypothetical protein